ncbi:bifunctional UDP-sugar hydrolase/5'-nucleotidase [soil metagenome]
MLAIAHGVIQRAGAAQQNGELRVTFIHTSDEHSAVLPAPLVNHHAPTAPAVSAPAVPLTRGGFARLSAVISELRAGAAARGAPALVTSAGDNIGGAPFAWLMLDGIATELALMVEMGYDVVTLGNHEFDYNSERLARYIAAAGYPAAAERTALVATNTHPPAGHPLGEVGLRRTHMIELPNGLRVGFFGLIGRGAVRFATLAPPVEFTNTHDEAASAVVELRSAGAHIVVAITHSGVAEDRELARSVEGIDVILGGHDHVLFDEPLVEAGTVIVHPGAHTRQVFVLEIGYDTRSGAVRVRNGETGTPYVVAVDASSPEDLAITTRVEQHRAQLDAVVARMTGGRFDRVETIVARSGFSLRYGPPMQETTLGNFVTDAMRNAVERATGERVDFAFQANGVMRADLVIGAEPPRRGDIALYDLASTVGMGAGPAGDAGYPLVSVWLTGDEVRRVLEISVLLSELLRNSYYLQPSGLRMRYDPGRAVLFRVPFRGTPIPTGRAVLSAERETLQGYVPLERGDTALYHVVTDYYVASFLPMVGRMLPRLALVPKDRAGNAIADIDDAVVLRDGRELKTWQAVLEYATSQPPGDDGVPHIAPAYAEPQGRLQQARGFPLGVAAAGAVLLLLVAFAAAAVLRVRHRRARGPA